VLALVNPLAILPEDERDLVACGYCGRRECVLRADPQRLWICLPCAQRTREVNDGRPQGEEARPEAGEGSPQVPERGAALGRIPQTEGEA